MVCRITSGFHVGNLVNYHYKKAEKSVLIGTSLMGGATDSRAIARVLRFRNGKNDIVKKPNIHISLNFHKDDKADLNDGLLGAIAGEYMEKMGYGGQPYAVFRHYDKEHPHIHIISSRISENGKKIKDSFEVHKSIRYCQMIERKYGLVVAKEQNRKLLNCNDLELPKIISEHKNECKHALTQIMDTAIHNSMKKYPTDEKEFQYFFEKNDLKMEKKEGGHYIYKMGKESKNLVSNRDLLAPNPDKLRKFFLENKKRKEKLLPKMKAAVREVLRDHFDKIDKSYKRLGFVKDELSDYGIRLEAKRRDSGAEWGKINGYLFFDDVRKIKYTATDLGLKLKDFEFLEDDLRPKTKKEILKTRIREVLREKIKKGDGFLKMAICLSRDAGVNLRLKRWAEKSHSITGISFYDKALGLEYSLKDLGWELERWKKSFKDDCTEQAMYYDSKIRKQDLKRKERFLKLTQDLIRERASSPSRDVFWIEKQVKCAGFEMKYYRKKFYFENFLTGIWYEAKADLGVSKWNLQDALGPYMEALKNEDSKEICKDFSLDSGWTSENKTPLPEFKNDFDNFLDAPKKEFKERIRKVLNDNLKKGDSYFKMGYALYRDGAALLKLERPAGKRIKDIIFYDKISGVEYNSKELGWELERFKGDFKDDSRAESLNVNLRGAAEKRKGRFQKLMAELLGEYSKNEKKGGKNGVDERVFSLEKRVKNIGFELIFDDKKQEFYLEHFLSKERYDCEADFGVSKGDFKAVFGEYMQAVKNRDSKKHFQYKLTKNTGQKRAKREGLRSVMGRVYAVYNGLKKDFEEKKKKIKLSDFKVLLVRKGIDLAVKRADFKGEKDKIRAYLFYDKKTGVKYSATDLKLKLRDFGFLEDDLKIEKNKNLEYPVNIGNVFRLFLGSSWGGEDPDPYKSVKRKKRMDRDLGIR